MKMARVLTYVCFFSLCTAHYVARADIYSFVDEAGVAHFSNVPNDTRYHLVLASPPDPAREPARSADHRSDPGWLGRSHAFDSLIDRAASESTVHPQLVRAIIVVESAFNPKAVSRRGAAGLMQLLPKTARRYGASNVFDPQQNITAGTRYLRDLMARYGNNLELVLAAYNAGEDAVERYGKRVPPFAETQQYVPAVLRIYRALLAAPATS
jgi:soluble lytic murein transglycosylase-like protein